MSPCPEDLTLYAFMDAEVSRDEHLALSRHTRRCSHCRDRLRSLSVVQGHLFRRPEVIYDDEFESRFRASLMASMVTSDEARRLARWRLAWPALAAGLLLAVGVVSWWPSSSPRPEERSSPASAGAPVLPEAHARDRRLAAAREDLLALVGRIDGPDRPIERTRLIALDRRFSRADSSLALELPRLLRGRRLEEDERVLAAMAEHGSRFHLPALRDVLARRPCSLAYRRAVVETAVRIGGEGAVRLIVRELRRGLPLEPALTALVEVGSGSAWDEVRRVVQERAAGDVKCLVSVLGKTCDERATSLLLQLFFDGHQSTRLVEELVKRPGVLRRARVIAWSRHTSVERFNRAVVLLGHLRDRASVPRIRRLVARRRHQRPAVMALATIADDSSMRSLAQRLDLHSRRGAREEGFQSYLTQHIATLGDTGADFYLDQAELAADRWDRHYVLAAGHCGSASSITRLKKLVSRDDLKLSVVSALRLIGDDGSVPLLHQLAGDRDTRVRRAAIEALDAVAPPPRASAWKGLVGLEPRPVPRRWYDLPHRCEL